MYFFVCKSPKGKGGRMWGGVRDPHYSSQIPTHTNIYQVHPYSQVLLKLACVVWRTSSYSGCWTILSYPFFFPPPSFFLHLLFLFLFFVLSFLQPLAPLLMFFFSTTIHPFVCRIAQHYSSFDFCSFLLHILLLEVIDFPIWCCCTFFCSKSLFFLFNVVAHSLAPSYCSSYSMLFHVFVSSICLRFLFIHLLNVVAYFLPCRCYLISYFAILFILLGGIVDYLFVQCYYSSSSFCLTWLFFLLFNVFFILLGTIAHISASSCLFLCLF